MSERVLALIDGAIDDWETSEDAMRWTADPEPATTDRLPATTEAFIARVLSADLTDWQREVLANAWRREFDGRRMAIADRVVISDTGRRWVLRLPEPR